MSLFRKLSFSSSSSVNNSPNPSPPSSPKINSSQFNKKSPPSSTSKASSSPPDFALHSIMEGRRSLDSRQSQTLQNQLHNHGHNHHHHHHHHDKTSASPHHTSSPLLIVPATGSIGSTEPRYRRVQSAADLPEVAPLHVKAKLFKAVKEGEYSLVWALLSKGADPSDQEDGGAGCTPLHIAAKEGNLPICQLLVSKGADVNAKDRSGQTPLHRASYWGRYGVVDFLVYVGANVNAADNLNQSPREIALHRNNHEVAELLALAKESKREKTWSVKKQFHQLLKDQAKEEKLLQKNRKLEEKLSQLLKEHSRITMLHKELEKRGKELSRKDQDRMETLETKIMKAKEDHRKNTIEITVTRSESFEKYAQENKAQTWMTFLQEL